jgi:hypothetical protein
MVALRDPQHERACQHLASGFGMTPEERDEAESAGKMPR